MNILRKTWEMTSKSFFMSIFALKEKSENEKGNINWSQQVRKL